MSEDSVLTVRNVTKRYGDLVAVDDVSLQIRPGEIFALLGPNGAGKTTLINCITGLTVGYEGDIGVAGYDVTADYRITRRLVGLVPQEINYDAFFNVRQTLEFQAGYFGVSVDDAEIDAMLEQFSLLDKAEETSRWLSGGMKRRLMICKALMHDPILLFLDEPTAGVDVELRDELWEYVRGLRDRGTTIVLTTHYLEEAEKLADRIGIIDRGALLRVDAREDLMAEYGYREARIEIFGEIPAGFQERFDDLDLTVDDNSLLLEYRDGDDGADESPIDRLLRAIYEEDLKIVSLEASSSSLEDVFRKLVYTGDRR